MASNTVEVGDKAPLFDVKTSDGQQIKLADLAGKKRVVLYFYPKDFTPVCTKETCGMRDLMADLQDEETLILGVSKDDNAEHERFRSTYSVEFPLVSDPDRALARSYGAVTGLRNLIGGMNRVTFVIDKQGTVVERVHAELSASKHVEAVRTALARCKAREAEVRG